MPPRVRRATLRDLPRLVEHRRRMWEDMGVGTRRELDAADRVYRRWARARLRDGTLVAWVAEAGGAAVGGGALWLQPVQPRPGWPRGITPYLLSMYTAPEWRGRGIAKRVVREAVRWARAKGYPRMTLHASDLGRPVYAAQGFRATREMKLQLRPEAVGRGRRRPERAKPRSARPQRRRGKPS